MIFEEPVYIYGSGDFGIIIANYALKYGIPVRGFVDRDLSKTGKVINGLFVYSPSIFLSNEKHSQPFIIEGLLNPSSIDKTIYVNCIFLTAKQFLIKASKGAFISFRSLVDPTIFLSYKLDLENFKLIFKDTKSNETITNLLLFQSGLIESQYNHEPCDRVYFDPEIVKVKQLNLLDCGAFNGDTIRSAHKYYGDNFKSVVAIEPSKSFLNSSSINYCKIHSIELNYFSCGLDNKSHFRGFSSLGLDSDSMQNESNLKFWFSKIDDLPIETIPNIIKFDIEGAELPALRGGINFLRKSRAILAISLYHNPTDFYEIPLYLYNNLDNYTYYFRQYAPNCWETILYAVPSEMV